MTSTRQTMPPSIASALIGLAVRLDDIALAVQPNLDDKGSDKVAREIRDIRNALRATLATREEVSQANPGSRGARYEHLQDRLNVLQNSFGNSAYEEGKVQQAIDQVQAEIAQIEAASGPAAVTACEAPDVLGELQGQLWDGIEAGVRRTITSATYAEADGHMVVTTQCGRRWRITATSESGPAQAAA